MKNIKKNIDIRVQLPSEDEPRVVSSVAVELEYSEVFEDYVLTEDSAAIVEAERAKYLGRFDAVSVKKLRERLNLTQLEMSSLLGLGKKTITRWESGKSLPSLSMSENLKRIELIKNLEDDGILTDEYINNREEFLENRQKQKEDERLSQLQWASKGEILIKSSSSFQSFDSLSRLSSFNESKYEELRLLSSPKLNTVKWEMKAS